MNLDTVNSHIHCCLNGLFHCPAEADTAFQLSGNAFRHQDGIYLRPFNFSNINIDLFITGHTADFLPQSFEFCAALADKQAGSG